MEQDSSSDNQKRQSKKSNTYFSLGFLFLLIMGLFWSVDASLVYIFLGIAVFFFFMAFYNRPFQENQSASFRNKSGSEPTENPWKNIFEKKQKTQQAYGGGFAAPSTDRRNRMVAFTGVAFFVAFVIFFIAVISGSDDDTSFDAVSYYQTAEQNYWAQDYDSARLNYRKAWKLNPEYPEAILGYGNVLAIQNLPDSAMIMFNQALKLNPEYKEASYSKALAYYNQEKYDESIKLLTELIQNNPDYYDGMLLLGDSYYAKSNYNEALPWYKNAYDNGGARSRQLCHLMAYIYDTNGDYQQAVDLYKEALTYDSTVVDIYKRLGELIQSEEGNYYRTQAAMLQSR